MDARRPGQGESWLRRILWQARNPWQADVPLGFVLDADGEVVGYHFVIVQPLWLDGRTVPVPFALDLFVAPEWRGLGHGLALIRAIFQVAGSGPVFTTSANEVSEALWTRLGAERLPRGEASLVRFRPSLRLAVAGLERLGLRLPRAIPPARSRPSIPLSADVGAGWVAEPLVAPYAAAAELWARIRSSFPLATDRSSEFLTWRYAADSPGGVLIGVRRPGGPLRGWYAYRLTERGEGTRVCLFSVLDVMGPPDDREALAAVGRDVDRRVRALKADVLEVRGMRREFRRALQQALRMHERRLPANPFLGRLGSSAPAAEDWHLVAGDGDEGFA